jgi:predicted regulator of Ras-like GTPase activity (Roadblock/LC7/MglB family)
MIDRLTETLTGLARMRGVRAAMLATESDGLAAASVIPAGDVADDALAAFATAVLRRCRMANAAAGYGATRFLVLDAERGRLLVAARGDMALVVLGAPHASTGLLRVAMQSALTALD